jgi:hypothetical protein
MSGWRYALAGAILMLAAGATLAVPYTPLRDDVVLERLPEKGDPSLAQLKRMRAALAAKPGDLGIALPVARRALDAARELGDPRFLGQAQAALAPWWTGDDVPLLALLLRATLKQSQHDFEGSAEGSRPAARRPAGIAAGAADACDGAGRPGRYADARRDCAALNGRVQPIVFLGCDAVPASLSGAAAGAYDALVAELDAGHGSADMREWALRLSRKSRRAADFDAAERHFREALALDPRDAYLKSAYADFLIDRDRPQDVLPLLRDDVANDGLLLRLVLAERRVPAARDAFIAHRNELAARFAAAQRRGDSLHRREEARFRLDIERDTTSALALARANWAVQREPADLRILVDAARAANDAETLDVAAQWVAATRVEDVAVASSQKVRR